LAQPKPDASRFIAILMGRLMSARPPLVEYLVDAAVMRTTCAGVFTFSHFSASSAFAFFVDQTDGGVE